MIVRCSVNVNHRTPVAHSKHELFDRLAVALGAKNKENKPTANAKMTAFCCLRFLEDVTERRGETWFEEQIY